MNNKYNSEEDIEQQGEIRIVPKIYDSYESNKVVNEIIIEKRNIKSFKSDTSLIIISDVILLIPILLPLIKNSSIMYFSFIYNEMIPKKTLFRMNFIIFIILWITYIGMIIYN